MTTARDLQTRPIMVILAAVLVLYFLSSMAPSAVQQLNCRIMDMKVAYYAVGFHHRPRRIKNNSCSVLVEEGWTDELMNV